MRKLFITLIAWACLTTTQAQVSVMVGDRVAAFYPENFEAAAHLPSPVFMNELTPTATQLPTDWQLRPRFSRTPDGHNVATFDVADADLYGTGEVYGDADGRAEGRLYEDAGNGFGYRRGDYACYQTLASVEGKTLRLTLSQTEGHRQHADRWLRIGQLVGGKVCYSPWQQGTTATMRLRRK